MNYPSIVQTVITKLNRAELAGVNAHSLPVALDRARRDSLPFETATERQLAMALLERIGYPETMAELELFLKPVSALSPATLIPQEVSNEQAVHYLKWVTGFLNDPDANIQKNARILLRWLVTNFHDAITASPDTLNGLRQLTDDPATGWKNAAFIVYALGLCGTVEDYDHIIRLAEVVIEHDREHVDMVVDALYRLYPPALINALQYFLESAPANSKQFTAGLYLLAQVAEIDERQFWSTYFDDIDQILNKVSESELASRNSNVGRILDRIEKHLALASTDEDS